MHRCRWDLLACFVALATCGCSSGKNASEPGPHGIRAEDIVGKWRLVLAGGKPPAELWIKSQEIEISADGKWSSKIEGEGQYLAGMNVKGGGTWSLADDVLTTTNGVDTNTSRVKIESGRLAVDPDCFMAIRKKGPAVTGEYERIGEKP